MTTDENFTFYKKPELDENAPTVPDGDYVAVKGAKIIMFPLMRPEKLDGRRIPCIMWTGPRHILSKC